MASHAKPADETRTGATFAYRTVIDVRMTQKQTFSLTFILIFVSLLVLLGLVFAPFLPTIVWATILAVTM